MQQENFDDQGRLVAALDFDEDIPTDEPALMLFSSGISRGITILHQFCSDIEPEVHDVAFLNDVVLAFEAQTPGIPGAAFTAQ